MLLLLKLGDVHLYDVHLWNVDLSNAQLCNVHLRMCTGLIFYSKSDLTHLWYVFLCNVNVFLFNVHICNDHPHSVHLCNVRIWNVHFCNVHLALIYLLMFKSPQLQLSVLCFTACCCVLLCTLWNPVPNCANFEVVCYVKSAEKCIHVLFSTKMLCYTLSAPTAQCYSVENWTDTRYDLEKYVLQFWEIHVAILRNTFCNVYKYFQVECLLSWGGTCGKVPVSDQIH